MIQKVNMLLATMIFFFAGNAFALNDGDFATIQKAADQFLSAEPENGYGRLHHQYSIVLAGKMTTDKDGPD